MQHNPKARTRRNKTKAKGWQCAEIVLNIFGLREGDVKDEHGEVGRSAAAAWAGSTRLNGEGLLEDDDVLDVGVHGALACLGQNGGQAGEEEVAAMLRKVVAWFGAAPADREAWLEFAGPYPTFGLPRPNCRHCHSTLPVSRAPNAPPPHSVRSPATAIHLLQPAPTFPPFLANRRRAVHRRVPSSSNRPTQPLPSPPHPATCAASFTTPRSTPASPPLLHSATGTTTPPPTRATTAYSRLPLASVALPSHAAAMPHCTPSTSPLPQSIAETPLPHSPSLSATVAHYTASPLRPTPHCVVASIGSARTMRTPAAARFAYPTTGICFPSCTAPRAVRRWPRAAAVPWPAGPVSAAPMPQPLALYRPIGLADLGCPSRGPAVDRPLVPVHVAPDFCLNELVKPIATYDVEVVVVLGVRTETQGVIDNVG
uniref:Mucin-like n=1 Tax=Oryza sativa subsp. indica TaxID=39946 RepID=C8TFN1_ORYSI|nr:mucin-like [Oryza sativa Indica Group]